MPKLAAGRDRPTRAAIYTRVSTDRQAEEGFSLDEQQRRGLAHIDRLGWQHAGTYREEGVSGAERHRPQLDRLLGSLDDVDAVIVPSLDRLGRSTRNLLELYDLFEDRGVALVSLRDNVDTSTPMGRMMRTVLSAVAEFERDLGKERTSAGIASRTRTTGKAWGTPRYPYRKRDDGHWEPDPAEVPIALRIFRERVERAQSKNAIAFALGRDGVPTRKAGSNWTATTVAAILSGRQMLGEFKHAGEWHRGAHDALISEEMWQAAQAMDAMGDRFRPSRGGRRPPLHLFTNGLLRCSLCFEAMLPRTSGDKYECRTRKQIKGITGCSMPSLPRAQVDAAGLAMFERAFLDLDATRAHVAADLDARLSEVQAQAARAAREVSEKTAQAARVERDYLAETLPADRYARLSAMLADELAAADAERVRLEAQADELRASRVKLDAEGETLRRLGELRVAALSRVRTAEQEADVSVLRSALATTFEAVYINPFGAMCMQPTDGGLRDRTLPLRTTSYSSGVPE